jgi:eukaryotic-like serine/threonine-protein kinase
MITVTNPERDPNDLTGQQCGGSYRIVRLLGAGGMGQVWLAQASELDGKEAAVKVLFKDLNENAEHLRRFKIEVRVVGGLRDSNVVEIWDAGTFADGRHYMIMEFCAGGSLASLLEAKGGKLSIEDTFMLTGGPAQAMARAHAARIVHRDIKPDNILLVLEDGRLRAKLGDFGIAKLNLERADAQRGTTMKAIGTPGFMAPEQLIPTDGVDSRADIYSFGCVLYLCLTGQCPYPPGNFYQYADALMNRRAFPRPRERRAEISLELDKLIMGCLEFNRNKRIQTIEEVMRRFAHAIPNGQALLRSFPRFLDSSIAPTATTISQSVGAAATDLVTSMSRSLEQSRRRSLRRISAAFLAGSAFGGGAAMLAGRASSEHDAPGVAAVATPAPTGPTSTPIRATAPVAVPATPSASTPPVALPPPTPQAATIAAVSAVAAPRVAVPHDAGVDAPTSVAVAPLDAAAPVPRVTVIPPDAPALAATPDAGNAPKPERPGEKRTPSATAQGRLHVEVDPWADVVIGDWRDTTPVTRKLSAGRHRVVLKNGSRTEVVDVVINPNKTTSITRSW